MGTFKLDGKEIAFEPGETIIQAAARSGNEIPHYCWHPGLSVAANCRMCLVEITNQRPMLMPILKWDEKKGEYVEATKPKLVPSCQQAAAEGLEVSTQSQTVKDVQSGVQEFLLLNHPVDCPICDQAGECKLQDYWAEHQHKLKRKESEILHKPKAVSFGPTIVYDAERCIVCTRCVRFCDEVVGEHVLDVRERGNRNEIVVSPGKSLDHKYTLMTEHVCPVGALTSKDFRFKARVWFLRSTPSVCNGCATGCNSWMDYDPRENRVYRLRPRDNAEVNKFWMCDDGMLSYQGITEGRVTDGRIGQGAGADFTAPIGAIAEAAVQLKGVDGSRIAVVLSAQHSTEDNHALATFARQVLKTERFFLAALAGWEGDKILRHTDNNPNRAGATAAAGSAGLKPMADLLAAVSAKQFDAVVVLGAKLAETPAQLAALAGVKTIWLTSHEGPLSSHAGVTIGIAAFGEVSGSFINAKGMAQQFRRAVNPPAGVAAAWQTLGALAEALGHNLGFATLATLRAAMPGPQPPALPSEARAKQEARV